MSFAPFRLFRLYENPTSMAGGFLAFCVCAFLSCFAFSQVQVVTEHNDVVRSGANTNETLLTPTSVSFGTFGKLFSQSVDGYVVGQPLYLSAVKFPDGSTHNVVFVATQHDSVFAFDADTFQAPLWNVSFINPAAGITTVPMSDYGCTGTAFDEMGILGTPVIDSQAGALFVVAKTLENGAYIYRLHDLSTTTGADQITPTVISASVTNKTGTLQFNPAIQMQRPALLLENGTIYVAFGSNGCDTYSYSGWLVAYDETTLQQVGAFATTPNGQKGALWQGGGGPAADADGTIFLATANGTFDANTGGSDYGDSLLHLSPASRGLAVLDYFTPYNQQTLFTTDTDLGSGGIVLLPDQDQPHTHEILGGGKQGTLYLVDRDNMGGYNSTGDTQIVQSIPGASSGELIGVPVYWNGNVYISGQADKIKAFSLSSDLLSPQPTSQTSVPGGPGGISLTANGSSSGILWALGANNPGVLYAFDASNLSTELYNSSKESQDKLGTISNFLVPTIANGKAYVGGTTAISVYALFPLIVPVAGNNQSAYAGTTLPVALQVQTLDAYQGNPVPNAAITCNDGGVHGSFSATMPMVTNSQGLASTSYTLPQKNQNITITCSGTGLVTTTFSEVDVAGPPSKDEPISGNDQTAPEGTQLPASLVAQIVDPYGFGIPGLLVSFSDGGAGGTFSAVSVNTDSAGKASTSYTTPNLIGTVMITASTTGLAPATFKVTVTGTTAGYTLSAVPSTLSVVQETNGSSTITVNPTNGFTGSVDLAASGLPSGVVATFVPTSTTTTSTLTLTASSSATIGGPIPVTVTGTSGALTQTATINLTVTSPPNFTLAAAPSTASVMQGSSITSAITVMPANGFTSSVSLAASGLPSGVTATFVPASTTTTSTLTLTASSSATTGGPVPVTVTGTSGTLTQTATVDLTVTAAPPPPSYSLAAGTANPTTISPGASSTVAITVTSANNYTGSVTLSCSILPAVSPAPTCSFGSSNPMNVSAAGGSATMTFAAIGPTGAVVRHSGMFYALWLTPGVALVGVGFGSRPARRKRLLSVLLLWMMLASLVVLPACGAGSSGSVGTVSNPGTPAGSYTITISGEDANNVTQSNTAPTVTVIVN